MKRSKNVVCAVLLVSSLGACHQAQDDQSEMQAVVSDGNHASGGGHFIPFSSSSSSAPAVPRAGFGATAHATGASASS